MNRGRQNRISDVAGSSVSKAGTHLLRVETGLSPTPPSGNHQALMTFRFRGDHSPLAESDIEIPLQKLGNASGSERWWYRGDVEHTTLDDVRIASCAEYLTLSINIPHEECLDVRETTRRAYELLFEALEQRPGFEFVRIWNFLGDINQGENDQERYRQLSIGRAEAFANRRIVDESAPAGTAIGTPAGNGLQIIALASARQLDPVENPQQTSAFNYPRQYGPSSPKFSRSGIVTAPCSLLFFVSGTAAVVGHESAFPFRTIPQLDTTLKNLGSLTDAVAARYATPSDCLLDASSHLRVYLRDVSDFERIRAAISTALPMPESQVIYLQGDICRRELMVEVEACTVIHRNDPG